MSPPQATNPNDVQQPFGTDITIKNVASKSLKDSTALGAVGEKSGVCKSSALEDVTGNDTGLDMKPEEEALGEGHKDEEKESKRDSTSDTSINVSQIKSMADNEEPESQSAQGTSIDTTNKTNNISLSSTPPPDPLPKALGKLPVRSPSPPPPPPKDDQYLAADQDVRSRSQSPASQGHKSSGRNSEDAEATNYAENYEAAEDDTDERSEIQSIMEQFDTEAGGPGAEEIMSPRLEKAQTMLDSPVIHPPRRSSLEPHNKPLPIPTDGVTSEQPLYTPPPRGSSLYPVQSHDSQIGKEPASDPIPSNTHAPMYKPTPSVPQPDPEPDLPFDFHRFLEQLRHRTADPVAKFLRSFLLEFGKKQWMVHEQVKIIADFLEFISKKMAQCEVWRTVSDAEFDNAREGMEKLVMNRLYTQTFSPAIPPPEPISHKGRRRHAEPLGPGRRGQHQEDVERDEVLAQKIRIYKWVKEEHLDIQAIGDKGRKFLLKAQQELVKIKSYRAPRDKVICILNCCKVIFGFLRTSQSDQSADAFVPLLIYTVLQANPDHLVSNVQYILRFRNQDKLGGETGYYISSLMGAIQFIESLDRTSLTITDEEFEKHVEDAVSAIAERHGSPAQSPVISIIPDQSASSSSRLRVDTGSDSSHHRMPSPHQISEKSSLSRPEVTPRNSLEAERAGPRGRSSAKRSEGELEEGHAAVAGLLRTIQRPLSTIGRIFSDSDTTATSSNPTPPPLPARHSDYSGYHQNAQLQFSEKDRRSEEEQRQRRAIERMSAEDAAARQASAEAEEARKIQRQEHRVVVETLVGMFPGLDREVIDDVVRQKEGRYVTNPFSLSPISQTLPFLVIELCTDLPV
ncbi:hypothetical protein GQ43DRAFT_214630 [Delitschia confertaspora ATCC 74209]|uniref:VPS9 domain-containing protein n=1 Tax=Delitschia confertaspora ATCC 74209 TaxID=1513339 RepID=A0A9P4JV77_9PLEO|nr:hypothetical protein GQ43DRAFT_214630 [Delitschia confertaspora ATCC 74209]